MRTRSLAVPTSSAAGSPQTRDRLRLMLTVSAVLGAALLWFTAGAHAGNVQPATESAPPPAMGDHQMSQKGRHFKELDKDGNGSLSKAELEQGAPRMAGHFDEFDANKDGSVSREEMRAAHHRMHENRQAHKAERFAAADSDKNGSL